jgi:anti-sigma regulatory factor (Ser/Thr protein kinase)
VTGNLCDIALNFFLVLGLNMGTRGAALSTALGQVITICIYLPGFFGKKHTLHFGRLQLEWLKFALSALKAGLATSVQYLYQTIFFLVCNNLLIRLGGESAVAVFDVIQNTSYLILYMFEGTGRAMQPILSTYQGEHNEQGKDNVARLGFLSGLAVGGALIAFVEIWPKGMCLLFGIAGSASESLAFIALRLYGAGALFAGINILLCSYFQACENEKPSFILETLRGAVLLLPMTFLCYSFGLKYFWFLFLLTEAGSLLIFLLLGHDGRYRSEELSEQRIYQRTIHSNAENVMDVCQELEAFCETWGADMRQQMLVTMTIEEIGMAILKHGFQGRTDGYIEITAIMEADGLLELHLRDDATTFNPFDMDTKKASADEDFDMDSMGVLVIKKRAREFFYRRYQGFNTLIIKI